MMVVPVYTTHKASDVLEQFLEELGIRAGFKIASTILLTRETYSAVQDAKKKIKRIGVKRAFGLAGMQLLFSGPRGHIRQNVCGSKLVDDNTKRTKTYARSKRHTLLDFSKLGKWNDKYKKNGVYDYIQVPFRGRNDGSKPQTDFYMGVISVAMILCKSGDVETFVCGADWKNVFLTYELPALMLNTKIKNINGVPASAFRKIFYSGDTDAVYKTFQKICESEIALSEQRMKSPKKHKRRLARRDHAAQTKFFELEQEDRKLELKRGTFIAALRGVLTAKSKAGLG